MAIVDTPIRFTDQPDTRAAGRAVLVLVRPQDPSGYGVASARSHSPSRSVGRSMFVPATLTGRVDLASDGGRTVVCTCQIEMPHPEGGAPLREWIPPGSLFWPWELNYPIAWHAMEWTHAREDDPEVAARRAAIVYGGG